MCLALWMQKKMNFYIQILFIFLLLLFQENLN